ncbi:MAG: hypothetical protein K0R92_379 [Lachnospiraceae bacterium]|jgi:hypothetical protein|nr:hypothetical protein [Lachnospiraceae bacterium]
MEVIVKIQGTEGLEKAILQLAQAVAGNKGGAEPFSPMPQQSIGQANQSAPVQQYAPTAQQYTIPPMQYAVNQTPTNPAQQIQQQSDQTMVPPQQMVPTTHTSQAYTQDQIAVAMTALCDAGKVPAVMGILSQFGAETLMQVPKEQYSALVTMLRGVGANI